MPLDHLGASRDPQPFPSPSSATSWTCPCVDGVHRRYLNLDGAASTNALPAVASRVHEFLPWYSSVHRGAGYKSRAATDAYEHARAAMLRFAGRPATATTWRSSAATPPRPSTTSPTGSALGPDDVVVTTVVEHHANLLPWARVARRRFVECEPDGTFTVDDVAAALDDAPRPKLLAITGASNVTGWMPPIDEIAMAAHERGVPVFVDAAQLAPHRRLPPSVDFMAWSGHKMYAPFGAGALVGPRRAFADGDPFLAGGGAVDLVDLDEVVWTDPPEREEAGSPNVLGAVALHAAIDEARPHRLAAHRTTRRAPRPPAALRARRHRRRHRARPRPDTPTLPIATFTVDGIHHALVAARLSAEYGIGVRHGCFCAHPYLMRLLHLSDEEIHAYRDAVDEETAAACPAPCGPAPPSPPPTPTSTASSTPSPPSPTAPRPRSPTNKTNTPATSGPTTPPQAGPPKTGASAQSCARG